MAFELSFELEKNRLEACLVIGPGNALATKKNKEHQEWEKLIEDMSKITVDIGDPNTGVKDDSGGVGEDVTGCQAALESRKGGENPEKDRLYG